MPERAGQPTAPFNPYLPLSSHPIPSHQTTPQNTKKCPTPIPPRRKVHKADMQKSPHTSLEVNDRVTSPEQPGQQLHLLRAPSAPAYAKEPHVHRSKTPSNPERSGYPTASFARAGSSTNVCARMRKSTHVFDQRTSPEILSRQVKQLHLSLPHSRTSANTTEEPHNDTNPGQTGQTTASFAPLSTYIISSAHAEEPHNYQSRTGPDLHESNPEQTGQANCIFRSHMYFGEYLRA